MNYARHRIAAKKKLEEKSKELAALKGADKDRAEKILINEAIKEGEAESSPEVASEPEQEEVKEIPSSKGNKKGNKKGK